MARNLLQHVQDHCDRTGLATPTVAISSTDKQVRQIVGLLQEFLDDLITRKWFSMNTFETTFVSTATESQGTLATLAPYGFEGIVPETFWNRTSMRGVLGSVSATDWQARKAANFSGTIPQYRIREGTMYFNPVPTAGDTYAFEYYSSYFISQADTTLARYWTVDTDTFRINDELPRLYLRWRWKAEKGLDYAEEFRLYERALDAKLSRDATPKPVALDMIQHPARPGIIIPAGSWPL